MKTAFGDYLAIGRKVSGTREKLEAATFGAGCFWGVEDIFMNEPGVVETEVGYSGGKLKNPTYENVCTHTTGHAEVVRVKFDPKKVSYEKLLDVFFGCHDPTTMNRQGPDVGSNYRSVIFFHSKEQEKLAKVAKDRWDKSGKFRSRIVTEIMSAPEFYRAEEYHQKYFKKNGIAGCHV